MTGELSAMYVLLDGDMGVLRVCDLLRPGDPFGPGRRAPPFAELIGTGRSGSSSRAGD